MFQIFVSMFQIRRFIETQKAHRNKIPAPVSLANHAFNMLIPKQSFITTALGSGTAVHGMAIANDAIASVLKPSLTR